MNLDPNLLVVLGVLGLELFIFVDSLRLVFRNAEGDLALLESGLVEDLRRRAGHGHSPDWLAYRDAVDRQFQPRDDRLRSNAAAALAAGLGGTVVAIIVHLVSAPSLLQNDPRSALYGMGVALFGSLCGVAVHLCIVLFLLPWAESRFSRQSLALLDRLREVSDQNPPTKAVVETFRKELETLQKFFTTEFAGAFSTALGEFPAVVQELRGHLDRVAEAVDRQSGAATETMDGLRASADTIADGSKQLEPAVRQLGEAGLLLDQLPERLGKEFEEHRSRWQEAMEGREAEAREQLENLIRISEQRQRNIGQQITEINQALGNLPDRVSQALSTSLQEATPRHANAYNQVLVDKTEVILTGIDSRLRKGQEQLEARDRRLQEQSGEWVRTLFEEVHGTVEDRLRAPMTSAAEGLGAAADRLEQLATGLESATRNWTSTHQEGLQGWKEAGQTIATASGRLAAGKQGVDEAVESLGRSASHLETVARVHESFRSDLATALRRVTQDHLEELRPLHDRVLELAAEMEATRDRMEQALNREAAVVTQLVRQVLAQRGILLNREVS